MHILTLGLNHVTAPVAVREKLALPDRAQQRALVQLVEQYGFHEAAILSTCNRSEIYTASDRVSALDGARRYLSEEQGVEVAELRPHFYELSDADAVKHLFSVACGIDSLVVGESQILKQVRDALHLAQKNGSARLLLNELFQRSLRVGKRARTETDIGRGRLSVSTAAVELASQIFDSLKGRSALLVGAGEMIELTAQYLVDGGIGRFLVANRTQERGAQLARRFQGQAVSYEALAVHMGEVDIVISSTAAAGFVVEEPALKQVMQHRRGRPLFIIDIAVPRDIDPRCREMDNVFLFDIDDLKEVVESNRADRELEIHQVQQVIEEELQGFLQWFNALSAGPLIQALNRRADQLSQLELHRWAGKLESMSDDDRKLLERILRDYGKKLLHEPLVKLREFASADNGYEKLDTVRRLFDLNADELSGGQEADGQEEAP